MAMLPDDLLEMAECQKDDLKRRIREFEDERDQLRAELENANGQLAAFQRKTFERAIAIARGCQIEYGGGYKDQREADAFHHGMTTVENCLRARQNPDDYQAALAEAMGLRELKREAEIANGVKDANE